MHEIGVVGIHPVALANQGREEARPRSQIDEALEGEAVEPAEDLERADEVLEVLLRGPPRRAAGLVHEIVRAERRRPPVRVLRREPPARPLYDGLARPRSHLAYSFSKYSRHMRSEEKRSETVAMLACIMPTQRARSS